MTDPVTAGAACAPAPVDLSGVDPARWPEIRRRVAILNEFTALHRPSLAVRTEFAERMGISVSQFLTLARVWRKTGSAAAIPGARSRNAVARPRRLPARATAIIGETIDALGPTARCRDAIAEVARRCAAEAVAPPSASTVANALADARAEMTATSSPMPEILIDECVARLPVARDHDIVMPRVLLAVALPERRVVAMSVSCDPATAPSPSWLMARLEEAGVTDRPVRAPHLPALERDAGTGLADVPAQDAPSLARVLGNRLGDVGILHRATLARPGAALVAARHASAIGIRDAVTALAAAAAAHNARLAGAADLQG